MNAYCMYVSFLFSAIESNDDCAEEGDVFEYQEEGDQGQENQGKPSTCYISESYHGTMHYSTLHCFSYIANYPWLAIDGDLAPQVTLLSSMEDDSLTTYHYP
jgi:hypothetical protein